MGFGRRPEDGRRQGFCLPVLALRVMAAMLVFLAEGSRCGGAIGQRGGRRTKSVARHASLSLLLRRMVTEAGGGVFRGCCVIVARLVRRWCARSGSSRSDALVRQSPASWILELNLPCPCRVRASNAGLIRIARRGVMEILGSDEPKLSRTETQYLHASLVGLAERQQTGNKLPLPRHLSSDDGAACGDAPGARCCHLFRRF